MLFFLTLRCSPLDIQLYEDITTLLLQEITQFISHTYCVEKDNTPDRHLHLLVKTEHRDLSHFKQIFKKKKYEPFFKLLKNKNVETNQHALDIKTIKEEDYIITLGYLYKEQFCTRRATTHTEEEITQAIKTYHSHKRIEQQNIPPSKVIVITVKNFHSHLEKFLSEHPEHSVDHWDECKKDMRMNGYSFFDISDKKVRIAIRELQMIRNPQHALWIQSHMEEEDLYNKWIKNEEYDPDWERTQFPEHLKDAKDDIMTWYKENKHKTEYWKGGKPFFWTDDSHTPYI